MKGMRNTHPHIGPATLRTLAMIMEMHQDGKPITVRSLSRARGVHPSATHRSLNRLRSLGLVTWEYDDKATIRPTCTIEMFQGEI